MSICRDVDMLGRRGVEIFRCRDGEVLKMSKYGDVDRYRDIKISVC